MFDLKIINSVLDQMEEERGIAREKMVDAIEQALATAYKKEFGKRGQIIRAEFDMDTADVVFNQIKIVVDESMLRPESGDEEDVEEENETQKKTNEENEDEEDELIRFDPEKHILIENAKLIKKDVELSEELVFPLDPKDDFGRIAAQTAKQVIIQKIREAEKESALAEFGQKSGDIVLGHVQRFERGNLYIDLGRVTGVMPYDEQIPGERFRPGERIRALLVSVDETARGIFLKLSRAHPDFLEKLFETEAPELQSGSVEVKAIAREAGSRSKIAVAATDPHIDPVGSLVGQRGVRVSTVMSELGGEKIDIIEWSEDPIEFVEDALSPAQILGVSIDTEAEEDERGRATVEVAPDQQSLAIGKGGQNVRLAAKLTGWKIDILSVGGDEEEEKEKVASESPESPESEEAESKTEGAEENASEHTDETPEGGEPVEPEEASIDSAIDSETNSDPEPDTEAEEIEADAEPTEEKTDATADDAEESEEKHT